MRCKLRSPGCDPPLEPILHPSWCTLIFKNTAYWATLSAEVVWYWWYRLLCIAGMLNLLCCLVWHCRVPCASGWDKSHDKTSISDNTAFITDDIQPIKWFHESYFHFLLIDSSRLKYIMMLKCGMSSTMCQSCWHQSALSVKNEHIKNSQQHFIGFSLFETTVI